MHHVDGNVLVMRFGATSLAREVDKHLADAVDEP